MGKPIEVPDVVPILPLRNSVLFPGSLIPIDVGRPKSLKVIEANISVIGLFTQRDTGVEDPGPSDVYGVGCAANVLKVIKLAAGNAAVILQGISRVRLIEVVGVEPFITARVQAVPDLTDIAEHASAMRALKDMARKVISLMPELPREASELVDGVEEPGKLADLVASNLDMKVGEKQEVLETFDVGTRLGKVQESIRRTYQALKEGPPGS